MIHDLHVSRKVLLIINTPPLGVACSSIRQPLHQIHVNRHSTSTRSLQCNTHLQHSLPTSPTMPGNATNQFTYPPQPHTHVAMFLLELSQSFQFSSSLAVPFHYLGNSSYLTLQIIVFLLHVYRVLFFSSHHCLILAHVLVCPNHQRYILQAMLLLFNA